MSRLDIMFTTFKSVPQKIKTLLYRQRWKDVLIFFFFVLLSLGFWLLQSLQQNYEIELSIPVRYQNVPSNIAFSDTLPDQIKIKVRDKGSVLLNYSFGRTFIPIEPSLKSLSPEGGTFTVSKKVIESNILKQLIATTALLSIEPQQIEIQYMPLKYRQIPVEFNGSIHTYPGYGISGEINIKPASVLVYAGDDVLKGLTVVKTNYVKVDNVKRTFTGTFRLSQIKGASIEPEEVSITFPVEEYTEKTLDIPVECHDLPKGLTLRTFPSKVQISCNVPLSRFNSLRSDEFAAEIHYQDLEKNATGTVSIELTRKPDWILLPSVSPRKIEFILEQNN